MTKCMCCEKAPAIPGSKFCQDCQGDLDIENARDMAEGRTMVKCMINHGFCEQHMVDCDDMGKCPVGEVTPCCAFHGANGSPDLSCGGDIPNTGGKHLRSCAYHGGGDCTCGRGTRDNME